MITCIKTVYLLPVILLQNAVTWNYKNLSRNVFERLVLPVVAEKLPRTSCMSTYYFI
jgi:hypothetical protein